MTEAPKALMHWFFKNTELKNLTAIVKPKNIPSKTVIEKLGFECVDTKVILYDSQACKFEHYRLYNSNL